jgi:hypothetical protein
MHRGNGLVRAAARRSFLLALSLVAAGCRPPKADVECHGGRFLVYGKRVWDTHAKLTWSRAALPTALTWADATAACRDSGMRLPDANELGELMSAGESADVPFDTCAFPDKVTLPPLASYGPRPGGCFWTSVHGVYVQSIVGAPDRIMVYRSAHERSEQPESGTCLARCASDTRPF